jgi:hypothetical protein
VLNQKLISHFKNLETVNNSIISSQPKHKRNIDYHYYDYDNNINNSLNYLSNYSTNYYQTKLLLNDSSTRNIKDYNYEDFVIMADLIVEFNFTNVTAITELDNDSQINKESKYEILEFDWEMGSFGIVI